MTKRLIAVLAGLFGNRVTFTLPSETDGVAARTFTSFQQAADESGLSRIYGGIHYSFDNVDGLSSGRALGGFVVGNFLRAVDRGPAAGLVDGTLVVVGSDRADLLVFVESRGKLSVPPTAAPVTPTAASTYPGRY